MQLGSSGRVEVTEHMRLGRAMSADESRQYAADRSPMGKFRAMEYVAVSDGAAAIDTWTT